MTPSLLAGTAPWTPREPVLAFDTDADGRLHERLSGRALRPRVERRKRFGGAPRKHPRAEIGDVFGDAVVIRLLPPDHTRNERVEIRDGRGERPAYVYNLRVRARANATR